MIKRLWHWLRRTAKVVAIAFWNNELIIISSHTANLTPGQRMKIIRMGRQLISSIFNGTADYTFINEADTNGLLPKTCTMFCLSETVIGGRTLYCEAPKCHEGKHRAGLPIEGDDSKKVIRIEWPIDTKKEETND